MSEMFKFHHFFGSEFFEIATDGSDGVAVGNDEDVDFFFFNTSDNFM